MENQDVLSLILQELKDIKTGQGKLEQQVGELGQQVGQLRQETRHTRILVEQQAHDIRLIAEQHTDVIAKLEPVEEIEPVKSRVSTLEHVVRTHTDEIQLLKRAE